MNDVTLYRSAAIQRLEAVADQAQDYAHHSKASTTLDAYHYDWKNFGEWCRDRELSPLPATPQTVALYLADLAQRRKVSTLERRLAAISQAHQLAGHESPTKSAEVRTVMKGIRRTHGTAQEAKAPATVEVIRRMVEQLPDNLLGIRDRALLLVGFAGAFRRSELVGLNVDDIAFTDEGLVVTLRRSKTDQEGEGRKVGIPYGSQPDTCPVRALRRWLGSAQLSQGAVFRPIDRWG